MTIEERLECLRVSRRARVVISCNVRISKWEVLVMDGHDTSRYAGDTKELALETAEHMSGIMPPEREDADCEAQ